jgi:hypothetical protein
MLYVKRILYLRYQVLYCYFVTADGFQNGCQELGSKYNMNWMLAWKSFSWQIKFQYTCRTIAMTNKKKSMIIGESNTDLKRLTGRLKLRFLTEIGRLHWNQGKKEVAHFAWFGEPCTWCLSSRPVFSMCGEPCTCQQIKILTTGHIWYQNTDR